MKLNRSATTFNLGDTSFRRKTLADDFKILVSVLNKTFFTEWDNQSQAAFYERVLMETDLFSRNDSEDFSKRGRTLSNSMVKIGLVDDKRNLSEVALNWINDRILRADLIEESLGLYDTNLIFIRQLLKLRVYDSDELHYFYPFRIALEFLRQYKSVPEKELLKILHSIHPLCDEVKIKNIINDYIGVDDGNEIFEDYFSRNFLSIEKSQALGVPENILYNFNEFIKYFTNRKFENSKILYFDFVNALINIRKEPSKDNLLKLIDLSKKDEIKTGFGFGKKPFKIDLSVSDFFDKNKDNLLLSGNLNAIYSVFLECKREDIIREYSDMTKRLFNLSGVIEFRNGLVSLVNREILDTVLDGMALSGISSLDEYEDKIDQTYYLEQSLCQILCLDEAKIFADVLESTNTSDLSELKNYNDIQRETRFKNLVRLNFPKEKLIKILKLFTLRKDKEIKKLVTEAATVPTIFEYVMAIAWFYISGENFSITDSLNLTLDGSLLPLSHAPGGKGDIVIKYDNSTLMLEVTLMKANNQKRAEMEPVIRHAANLTIEEMGNNKRTSTIFISDELDMNTINIWRAVHEVKLMSSSSISTFSTTGVTIFPITIEEVIKLLENPIDCNRLITVIHNEYDKNDLNLDDNWRTNILKMSGVCV